MNSSRHLSPVDALLKRTQESVLDELVVSGVAAYACVRLSGILEALVKEALHEYISSRASKPIAAFAERRLQEFQNPRPEKIIQLLSDFDPRWSRQLEDFWEGEIKDAIGSVVGNRHLIAHGGTTTITVKRILGWRSCVGRFIRKLTEILQLPDE